MSDRPTPTTDPTHAPPAAPAWLRDAIAYQVYPLGFCGAPREREDLEAASYGADGENVVHRLGRVTAWLDHLVSLGANVLILNPIFDSVSHGYDTLDHRRIDPRLGDDADVEALFAAAHERGVRVILDGVFNHVSERHPLVRAALAAGPGSPEGARIRWSGEHPYGFEGNADLVELDLSNPDVRDRVADVMTHWLDRGADGWRLDVMYAPGPEAWAPILDRVREAHPDAWIYGEMIHGDYAAFARDSHAPSITQYELWKAIWSSLREHNLFELAHALGRHQGFLDAGLVPQTFIGNHDTSRIASQVRDGRDLAAAYALLALLPGVATVYAGDEFGAIGVKEDRPGGDDAARPSFPDSPVELLDDAERAASGGEATAHPALLKPAAAAGILEVHRRVLGLRRRHPWLAEARVAVREDSLANGYAEIELTGGTAEERLVLAINLEDADRPAPGEVIEAVSGADMLDAVGPAAPGVVPAHGVAVVR